MGTPLQQEPDEVPIHEQVRQLISQAHRDRMAPIGIMFSTDGYRKARNQTVPGMQAFTAEGFTGQPTDYLGLPFTVDKHTDAQADVRLKLVPGGSPEAQAFRSSRRATTPPVGAVRVTAKGPMDKPTIQVLAEGLTKAQLSDLISAWVDANPNQSPVTDMLVDWVQTHGRFE
jgi:hypothetical protein